MADAPRPYTRGWRAPWRGQWGTFADGHSRLSRLATRIERELAAEYLAESPLERRRLARAARFSALADSILATIGQDSKSTRRAACQAERAADAILARLRPKPVAPANGTGVAVRRFSGVTP